MFGPVYDWLIDWLIEQGHFSEKCSFYIFIFLEKISNFIFRLKMETWEAVHYIFAFTFFRLFGRRIFFIIDEI